MGRLRDWWDRLTGRAAAGRDAPRSRAVGVGPKANDGELELVDEPPKAGPSRRAEAGFDPYSSDAGYTKPHSWERLDHD